MKLNDFYTFKPELKESVLDKKVFYCSSTDKLVQYARVLGNIRFIYDISINKFILGKSENFVHIQLLEKAIKDGKYGDRFEYADNEECGEYYSGNIEGPELTGAIVMKNATRNIEADAPDTTKKIFEYTELYLCNGLWIKDKLSQSLGETPKEIY